jgi:hypothetical protein
MQAKFINVCGQWVHPDFFIFTQKIDDKDRGVQLCSVHPDGGIIIFQNKTIDEVAEEYNRQVDKTSRNEVDDEIINKVYSERNSLAIAFAIAQKKLGFHVGIGVDHENMRLKGKCWDAAWCKVLYVDLPKNKQISWHLDPISAAEAEIIFSDYKKEWDGSFLGKDNLWFEQTLVEKAK